MKVDDAAVERLAAMVAKAQELLKTYRPPPDGFIGFEGWVDSSGFAEWRTQSLVLFRQLLGPDHTYTVEFAERTAKESVPSSVHKGVGVLSAARGDIVGGYLADTRELLAAEVFADLLDMAEHLVATGYKDPAASLAGAVLEDGLRRACTRAGLAIVRADGLDSLTKKLATAGRLAPLAVRKLDTWRTLRNSADHGHFDQVEAADVRAMIEGVGDVLDRLSAQL